MEPESEPEAAEVDESDALVDTASELLSTIEINRHTPLDIALLFSSLALQTHMIRSIKHIEREVAKMALDFTALNTAASDAASASNQAVTLIEQLAADSNDPAVQAQVDSITSSLQQSSAALLSSVEANTPVDPEPAPAPEPAPSA